MAVHINGSSAGSTQYDGRGKLLRAYDGPSEFIPFERPKAKQTSPEDHIDINDILLVAWVLLIYQRSGNGDIEFTWGYNNTKDAGDSSLLANLASSTGQVYVERTHTVLNVLEAVRLCRQQSVPVTDALAQEDANFMFINDASDSSKDIDGNIETNVCNLSTRKINQH